jgi:hypothetical protein
MSTRRIAGIAVAGTITMGMWIWIPAALGGSAAPTAGQTHYLPIQGIIYDFGSKSLSGYFVEQDAACVVTLMIAEKANPEEPLLLSPARVRLVLYPGQIAGLDSEEGRSLNVTCGANATTLIVDADGRDRLVEQQMATLKRPAADSQGLATLP